LSGDKETFWLGWELVGDPDYAFHGGDAGIMGDLDREARLKKEAAEKKRQEEEEEKRRQDIEAEIKRQLPEVVNNQEPQQQPDAPAGEKHDDDDDDDAGEDKQLRKRSDPSPDTGSAPVEEALSPRAEPAAEEPQAPFQPAAVPPPAPAAAAPEEPPVTYTLCSPQLLHMDTDDTPLWFNGWLLDNKFADKRQKKFGSFKHYLIEPKEVREPGAWQLHENNECCLTTDEDKMHRFSEREVRLLERMMAKAREVGAPGA
jgi:hypothetical protein